MQEAQEQKEPDYEIEMEFDEPEQPKPLYAAKPEKLSEDNLSRLGGSKKVASDTKSKKSKKSQKPAWAVTPKQEEDQKEAEIDNLIEFAYDLDYEKYMEDYEVRQALAIIKDRVTEIK